MTYLEVSITFLLIAATTTFLSLAAINLYRMYKRMRLRSRARMTVEGE